MADCFISYRRVPSSAVATALQAKLESKYRFDVYVDTTRTDGTTVRFPERLMTAIADAPVFVCLLGERDGQHTLESAWVLKEIQQAHDLGKFCIPVFQESYYPLPGMPPAVDYLLGFDGVHILDQKNIMIDDSVRQLADLIRPHRKPRRRWLWPAAILITALALIGILLLTNGDDGDPPATDNPTSAAGVGTAFLPSATPTDELVVAGSATVTLTLSGFQRVQTAEAAQAQAVETQAALDEAATANSIRDANATGTAARLQATETAAEATLRALSATPTLSPEEIARTPVTRNADWTPVEREFDLPGGGTVTMVLVPAGCFMMGSTDEQIDYAVRELGANPYLVDDEQPVHEQCFDEPFWIDKYEVTNAQIAAFLNANGNQSPDGFEYLYADDSDARIASRDGQWVVDEGYVDHPAIEVTWFAVRDYCAARGGGLPTEAEWEYAARGPDSLVYPWGNAYDSALVIGEDDPTYGDTSTAPVGSRPSGASWVGAHDLSGNVWEWVSSLYYGYPYSDNHEINTNTGGSRVLRGGSWDDSADGLRVAYRVGPNPGYPIYGGGGRCARSS